MQSALEGRMEEVRKQMHGEGADTGGAEAEPGAVDIMEHDRSTGARPKRRR